MTMHANNEGRLLGTLAIPPAGGENMAGGLSYTEDLQVYSTSILPVPANYVSGGLIASNDGQLYVTNGQPITGYIAGFPISADGAVVIKGNGEIIPLGTPFIHGIAVGETGVYAFNTGLPIFAEKIWGSRFDGSISFGPVLYDDESGTSTPTPEEYTQTILGTDSQGYDWTSDLAVPFNCVNPISDIVYILTGNPTNEASVPNYAVTSINTVPLPAGVLGKEGKIEILNRVTAPNYGGNPPQIHFQIRRGFREAVQPVDLPKFCYNYYFKLPADLLAKLSAVPGANWFTVNDWKTGFQWHRTRGVYYYGFGDFRYVLTIQYSGGVLNWSSDFDGNANTIGANFTGSITGTVLTVTAATGGAILDKMLISGAGVSANTIILNQVSITSGFKGGLGTYNISVSQNVGSVVMTGADPHGIGIYSRDLTTTGVDLDTWLKLQVYFERPASQSDVSHGRIIATVENVNTKVVTLLSDRSGQPGTEKMIGTYNNPIGRIYFGSNYTDCPSPIATRTVDFSWYDKHPDMVIPDNVTKVLDKFLADGRLWVAGVGTVGSSSTEVFATNNYQDTARTIPAVIDAGVGAMVDVHYGGTTFYSHATSVPVLRQTALVHRWEFSSGDRPANAAMPFQMANDHCVTVVCNCAQDTAGFKPVFHLNNNTTGEAASIKFDNLVVKAYWNDDVGTVGVSPPVGYTTTLNQKVVVSARKVGNAKELWVNGALISSSIIAPGTVANMNTNRIGGYSGFNFVGDMASVCTIKGTVTDEDLLVLQRGLGALYGIVIP